jgi:hypothetical protein
LEREFVGVSITASYGGITIHELPVDQFEKFLVVFLLLKEREDLVAVEEKEQQQYLESAE